MLGVESEFKSYANVGVIAWGQSSGQTTVFGQIRFDCNGSLSWREPSKVSYADGSPYIKDNEVFSTATDTEGDYNSGLNAMQFGVYARDLTSHAQRVTGRIATRSTFTDGKTRILSGSIGKIIYDDTTGDWLVFGSSCGWENFSSPRRRLMTFARTKTNPLNGVNVFTAQSIILPGTNPVGVTYQDYCYDFDVIKIGSLWYAVYAEDVSSAGVSPHLQLRLATSPDIVSGWTLVASSDAANVEGFRFVKVGGTYYIVSGFENGFACWSFSTSSPYVALLGNVDIPALHNGGYNYGHPRVGLCLRGM